MAFLVLLAALALDGGKVSWTRDDFDGALQKAREGRRPLLVYFTADW